MCCGRCGAQLSGGETEPPRDDGPPHPGEVGLDLDSPLSLGTTNFESWQLDQNVRALQARLDPWQAAAPPRRPAGSPPASSRPQWRVDAAHLPVPAPHRPKRRTRDKSEKRGVTFTNSALVLGLLATVGGMGLLGWSVVEARGDLWNVGVSAAVAGGLVFLLGLVLQLERIWHNSRFAVYKLRQIDGHLQDLHSQASLAVTHGSASQAFYSHLADQAPAHLLLADLKGQLDLLAMNLARR